ncbi:TPA: TetR/AcrR family transcriptional regulator [Streptococcus suis]
MTTKKTIMSLGRELIQLKGINGFSFADIANSMGIKKASIHYYFPSKSDLIEEILDQYTTDFFDSLEEEVAADKRKNLEVFVAQYRQNLVHNKICLCSDLAMDTNNLSDDINKKVAAFFQANLIWLEKILDLQEQGKEVAADFFAQIQGAQLISRNQGNTTYFDQVMARSIERLV